MIRITDVKLPLSYSDSDLKNAVCKALRTDGGAVEKISMFRRAVDARRKSDIHFTVTADVWLNTDEKRAVSRAKNSHISIAAPYLYKQLLPKTKPNDPPVVVGAGPAGLFAALVLARAGLRPVLIERGKDVDARTADVNRFWREARLDTESNVQFGEGGAGTFSDGKLNTGTKDVRARFVLNELASHGAPEEILYYAKPHIGTDKLKITVGNIRKTLISLGVRVLFQTKLTGIRSKNGAVCAVCVERDGKEEIIETERLILAVGHSARDTFEMLCKADIAMQAKPFSVGARIEHLQSKIDAAQYGKFAGDKRLGAADYKLSAHTVGGRGVYTFCMCPGGSVVAATSENGTVVTNGMSEFARDGINANSALLVGVSPSDYDSDSPLAGVDFQRRIERAAFVCGGGDYKAPVQRLEDFVKRRKSTRFGEVLPSYLPGTAFAELDNVLPEFVTDSMRAVIYEMDAKLNGFAAPDALLTGAETRSSSPVRILRDEDYRSVSLKGLYPCGEGAGYAGGIISAAADGVRCAEKVILSY